MNKGLSISAVLPPARTCSLSCTNQQPHAVGHSLGQYCVKTIGFLQSYLHSEDHSVVQLWFCPERTTW